MQKETDLEAVKGVARALLYIPVSKTPLSPAIVHHPFTPTGFVVIDNSQGVIDITANNTNLCKWQQRMMEEINKADSVAKISSLFNNPYRLTFLKFAQSTLSREDFSFLLLCAWISSENPNQDANVSRRELIAMFHKADKNVLMTGEERRVLATLEDRVTVYRGVTSYNGKSIRALSWTLSKRTAEWFSQRYDTDGKVYEAEIEKKYIFAYLNGRNESEIIVNPKHLENIQEWQSPTMRLTML